MVQLVTLGHPLSIRKSQFPQLRSQSSLVFFYESSSCLIHLLDEVFPALNPSTCTLEVRDMHWGHLYCQDSLKSFFSSNQWKTAVETTFHVITIISGGSWMVTDSRILVETTQKDLNPLYLNCTVCWELLKSRGLLSCCADTAVCICTPVLSSTNERQRRIYSWPMTEH